LWITTKDDGGVPQWNCGRALFWSKSIQDHVVLVVVAEHVSICVQVTWNYVKHCTAHHPQCIVMAQRLYMLRKHVSNLGHVYVDQESCGLIATCYIPEPSFLLFGFDCSHPTEAAPSRNH